MMKLRRRLRSLHCIFFFPVISWLLLLDCPVYIQGTNPEEHGTRTKISCIFASMCGNGKKPVTKATLQNRPRIVTRYLRSVSKWEAPMIDPGMWSYFLGTLGDTPVKSRSVPQLTPLHAAVHVLDAEQQNVITGTDEYEKQQQIDTKKNCSKFAKCKRVDWPKNVP